MMNFRAPIFGGGAMNPQGPMNLGANGIGSQMMSFRQAYGGMQPQLNPQAQMSPIAAAILGNRGGMQGANYQPQMNPQGLPNVSQMAAQIGGMGGQGAGYNAPGNVQSLGMLGNALMQGGWGGGAGGWGGGDRFRNMVQMR